MSVSYNLNIRFEKHPYVIYRKINGKSYLLNYKAGNFVEINDIACLIWNRLPNQLLDIINEIATKFKISKQSIEKDIVEFFNFLKEYNFVLETYKKHFSRNIVGNICFDKIKEFGIKECIPIIAKVELLYHCNLKCIHCYTITERWKSGNLTTEKMKLVIDQLYDIGTVLVSFTGGEIFVREDLWDLIDYANKKEFLIELLTNGSLITEEDVERLKNYRICNIQISLYSHDPDVHDTVTGIKGSYVKTIRAIRLLIENNFNVEIVTPLMKINFSEYKRVRELATQIGAKHYYTYPIFERYNNSKDIYNLRISRDQILQFFRENPKEISCREKKANQTICEAGTNQCSISPFGEVYPCFHNMLPIKLGNLLQQSLKDIWQTSKFLLSFRNLKIRDLNKCLKCPAIAYCHICPGLNMKANNDILKPAQVCCDYAFSAKDTMDSILTKKGGDEDEKVRKTTSVFSKC